MSQQPTWTEPGPRFVKGAGDRAEKWHCDANVTLGVPPVRYLLAILALAIPAAAHSSVLNGLASPRGYTSHRVSSYATDGGNADGGQARPMKPGEFRVVADIKGPGEIAHIWFTLAPFDKDVLCNLILRMYWDDEPTPSVEAPIGAFFGLGHGKLSSFDSLPISVVNERGLNCFFPMPFNRRARITLGNQSGQTMQAIYYYVDYRRFSGPQKDILYFHAQYRQAKPALGRDPYVAFEAAGRGHYVGQFYYIRSNSGGWWGEGDDIIQVDGDVLYGTGMEDYFGGAWGMKPGQTFSRFGAPLFEVYMVGYGNENTAYRWHIEDAIAFRKHIRFTHEHGSENDRNDDFFSVSFWYQTHPRAPFPPLPSKWDRMSFHDRKQSLLEQKRWADYRALLQDFMERATDKEALETVKNDLEESYRLEKGEKP